MNHYLTSSVIDTPIGEMTIITDDKSLYLIEFSEYVIKGIEKLKTKNNYIHINAGETSITRSITQELIDYFNGNLKNFSTNFILTGSDFQKSAWQELHKIPYGKTISYKEQGAFIKKPLAYRAVANANSANILAIIIPCHRIINHNGRIGGYKAGIERKKWLLAHERRYQNK